MLGITKEESYLRPGNSPWSRLVAKTPEDSIPGLVLAQYKEPLICIPWYVYNGDFAGDNRITSVIPFSEWLNREV
ncbi:MAG: hypothetical protein Unbinned4234contig1002_31 [Prokaryotic dsDNA virus sp.]|jgi:hypothetical protein|nr:MAG: hypothetical protein Unbinned4234contig1002_31 [Prokaryotic dsDNA virus sp.]|tara:strand:+ start:287 stop:511 length:225 start_codon:yes stop_codon:yes gene_type:complete